MKYSILFASITGGGGGGVFLVVAVRRAKQGAIFANLFNRMLTPFLRTFL